jgi:hypothetical protein
MIISLFITATPASESVDTEDGNQQQAEQSGCDHSVGSVTRVVVAQFVKRLIRTLRMRPKHASDAIRDEPP